MKNFIIGNWNISEDGISWNKSDNEYFIPKEDLIESGSSERKNMYDWLVHLPTKDWLSAEDIYALNTAFIYAMELYNFDFKENSFVESFMEQQKEMKYK